MTRLPGRGPRLAIASSEPMAAALAASLGSGARLLPAWNTAPLEENEPDPRVVAQRMRALADFETGACRILVCGPLSAIMAVPGADTVRLALTPKAGMKADDIEAGLLRLGYLRTGRVDRPGTFARHGAVIDAWSDSHALRMRLDDGAVHEICIFDPDKQRTLEGTPERTALPPVVANPDLSGEGEPGPSTEWTLRHERRTLGDLFADCPVLMADGVAERGRTLIDELDGEVEERREAGEGVPPRLGWLSAEEWAALAERAERLPAYRKLTVPVPPPARDAIVSEWLTAGDRVVHLHHGIGVYRGLGSAEVEGSAVDTLSVEFADGTLDVPAQCADLVWRHGPAAEGGPALDRLRNSDWTERMAGLVAEMREATGAIREALEARARQSAPSIVPHDALGAIDAEGPPLTADQRRACDAIAEDMTSGTRGGVRPPMDRLVCGDTGFGKTEVILRAVAAVALAGHQVLVAAPTVLLVAQHERTFRERLARHGVEVRALTGATPEHEREEVLAKLHAGQPIVVVGTVLLAGEEIRPVRPGLLVLDEEQRFGAATKKDLRAKMANAHVLATTATPIPRTMMAALVGLREVSTIRTAPGGRRGVATRAPAWSPGLVVRALRAERAAGGRSFVVVPRIGDMDAVSDALAELAPELRVTCLHGRMDDDEATGLLERFRAGEADVLLCTTVIETGIDLPDANLMVVLDAGRLGLGQLHQLRGRVGRGLRRGRALLFGACGWTGAEATEEGTARLGLLEAHDELGAGFSVAARDLEQRGSGQLFGECQAGHSQALGLEFYGHLIEQALADRLDSGWGEATRMPQGGGRLPPGYIMNDDVRARLYGRIAKAADTNALDELSEEIVDRFGPLPEEVKRLFESARTAHRWGTLGVRSVGAGPKAIAVDFETSAADRLRDGLTGKDLRWKEGRLVVERDDGPEETQLDSLLDRIEAAAASEPAAERESSVEGEAA